MTILLNLVKMYGNIVNRGLSIDTTAYQSKHQMYGNSHSIFSNPMHGDH